MTKYRKGGLAFKRMMPPVEGMANGFRKIINPSLRDHRKHSDVLMGKKEMVSKKDEDNKIIPICFTIDAAENFDIVNMLDRAIIAENSEIINIAKARKDAATFSEHVKGMSLVEKNVFAAVFVYSQQ